MKTAIVFRAHFFNDAIRRAYEQLREQAGRRPVFVAFDATNEQPPELPDVFAFTQAELKSSDLHHQSPWLNGDHPLLLLRRAHPGFDAYWQIEYDVRSMGDWSRLLDSCDAVAADFLATQVARFRDDFWWAHWGRSSRAYDRRHWRHAFFPVVRLSSAALDVLEAEYRAGTTGFCEFVAPTVVQRAGLSLVDINDIVPGTWHSSTFRFRPVMNDLEPGPGVLRHPVREEHERHALTESLEQLADELLQRVRILRRTLETTTVDGRDERSGPHRDLPGPYVIAGVGGSGSRVVADLMREMAVDTGLVRPATRDNLWFSALLFRAMDLFDGIDRPKEEEIYRRLRLFDEVSAAEYLGMAPLAWQRLRCVTYAFARCRFNRWETIRHDRLLHELRLRRNWQTKSRHPPIAWGFKEPSAHIFLPQLIEHYPDLRFILVVRRPLAMASNPNQAQQHMWGPVFGVHGDSPAASLEYWQRVNRRCVALMQGMRPGRGFVLRYEDLCERPEKVIEQLASFVGAAPSRPDLARMVRPSTRSFETSRDRVGADELARAEALFASLRTGIVGADRAL